ncbi:AraC family transcriptional regulator [Saccharothrix variisporea]|uniref:Helix-turn-helix protein n=1 Tax=Saccharothrix variisporea TaxID=543527 RepID=A0A495XMR4_9PSEU|nr:AraC family transcriptional regulator [Saccharothrix variisporea]RKT74204.1 helix-turn-helix protein [Saccharothrix variisporea]
MSVVRSAGLRGFRATVAELGGHADDYAAAAGLPVAALDVDDLLVSDRALVAVLEIAAEALQCPDLGLRVASRQDFGMLGPLALAIRNSPTVADALECTSRYLFVHARSLSLTMEDDPYGARGVAALRYGQPPWLPVSVQATDLGLGFLHRAIKFLVGGSYGLRSVELPYTPVSVGVYEEFFGTTVHVGRSAPMLRVPRSLAAQPLAGGDERVWRLALAFLAEQTAGEGASVALRVRGVVVQSLGTVPPEVGAVARLVNMHPRTLQRRLAAEGTTFAEILDDVRRQAALRYLTTTDMPMSQVAGMLGLSEQSALSRCCRRWWGATPSAIRRSGPPPGAGPSDLP